VATKGLATLIRLSKWTVDDKRRILTALQVREDEILAEIRAAEAQLIEEQRVAAADAAGIGFVYGAYAQAWLSRRAQLVSSLEAVRAEIITAGDDLSEAFNQLKTYEITQRDRDRRAAEERDRKEQAFLDEIGLNIHRRRDQGDPEA
jgi:flagellar biosynthesis chaperone FliJ